MASKQDKTEYRELVTGVPPATDVEYSLDDILTEYGGGQERRLLSGTEAADEEPVPQEAPAAQEPSSEKPSAKPPRPRREAPEKPPVQTAPPEPPEEALPRAPRPISLEEVVGSTVNAVMAEEQAAQPRPRRALFSRRNLENTQPLTEQEIPEEPVPEPIGPEPELYEAAAEFREAWNRRKFALLPALLVALLSILPIALEQGGLILNFWAGNTQLQSILLLSCLVLQMILCRHVFGQAVAMLLRKRCTSELLIALSALVCAGDCVCRLLQPARSAVMPYAPVAVSALFFAQLSVSRERRGLYDTFRTAAIDDEPPYLVTDTERGACKQRGATPGFYTTVLRDNFSTLMQTVLLPLVLMASLVFAGLTSFSLDRKADFFLNWSAILSAGATFSLPLCWGLPWSNLTHHLQRVGCAVAGWFGAERISRRHCMILTDADLFPPGTIQLNGVKVYNEEMKKAVSYAATMARAAGSGMERLFDGLLRSELGQYESLIDFRFFEEGGWSAAIHGESVLMGTASFMRKMDVRIPSDINLKTGVFLSIDRQLTAVFAVKYNPSENVDFALRIMRQNHITPILAARDPNITPALLKRKFHKGVRVEYPDLTSRVALSETERDRDLPRALLFREGLLPYAEAVTGSRRLCRAVRRSTLLSLAGSIAGTLLVTYLVSLRAYSLLTPLTLEIFLLLWTLPVLLMSDWVCRY